MLPRITITHLKSFSLLALKSKAFACRWFTGRYLSLSPKAAGSPRQPGLYIEFSSARKIALLDTKDAEGILVYTGPMPWLPATSMAWQSYLVRDLVPVNSATPSGTLLPHFSLDLYPTGSSLRSFSRHTTNWYFIWSESWNDLCSFQTAPALI